MFRLFRIVVEIPALDRLMDYLDAQQQGEIDAGAAQVLALTQRLSQSGTQLGTVIKEK